MVFVEHPLDSPGSANFIMKTRRNIAEIQIDVKAILHESEFPPEFSILHLFTTAWGAPIQSWEVRNVSVPKKGEKRKYVLGGECSEEVPRTGRVFYEGNLISLSCVTVCEKE